MGRSFPQMHRHRCLPLLSRVGDLRTTTQLPNVSPGLICVLICLFVAVLGEGRYYDWKVQNLWLAKRPN